MVTCILATLLISQPAPQLDITYRKVNDVELKLDFYPPVTASADPAPMVIVIHGGAWITGKRQDMASMCQALSQHGFGAATVQYRLAPTYKWPSQLDDVQSAVRFMRANSKKYGIDPDRFGAVGASAGAHLAMLLGSLKTRDMTGDNQQYDSRVKAVVNLFGPTDLVSDFEPFLAGMIAQQLTGKKLDAAEEELKGFSPVNCLCKDSCPIFTIHGTEDKIVPVKQAARLDEACRKLGIEHTMRIIPELGHEDPTRLPKGVEALNEALTFLVNKLGKKTL